MVLIRKMPIVDMPQIRLLIAPESAERPLTVKSTKTKHL